MRTQRKRRTQKRRSKRSRRRKRLQIPSRLKWKSYGASMRLAPNVLSEVGDCIRFANPPRPTSDVGLAALKGSSLNP